VALAGVAPIATVFAAVYHAEVVAHRVGETCSRYAFPLRTIEAMVGSARSVFLSVCSGRS
jgi:hypothetical protein